MLKRHFKAYSLAALAAFALLAGNGPVVPAAHAQDRGLEDVLNKLEQNDRGGIDPFGSLALVSQGRYKDESMDAVNSKSTYCSTNDGFPAAH